MTSDNLTPGEMPSDVFDRIGQVARQAVLEQVTHLLQASDNREAQQAVVLGAIGGAVECFVCAASEGVSRERLKDALRDVVSDFIDQAKDHLIAGVQ
jgi:hypothetical protein